MGGTILLTGPGSSADIALAARAVARQLAERNVGRTLLVDADLEERPLTAGLNAPVTLGLADVLLVDADLTRAAVSTDVENLQFLPSGRSVVSYRKLEPSRMIALTALMKRHFPYVCIAGGDPTASLITHWSRYCDATFLVVGLNVTDRYAAEQAADHLRHVGARLIGCVTLGADT